MHLRTYYYPADRIIPLRMVRFAQHLHPYRAGFRVADAAGKADGGAPVFSFGQSQGRVDAESAGRGRGISGAASVSTTVLSVWRSVNPPEQRTA